MVKEREPFRGEAVNYRRSGQLSRKRTGLVKLVSASTIHFSLMLHTRSEEPDSSRSLLGASSAALIRWHRARIVGVYC